jgi:hypothetical protein
VNLGTELQMEPLRLPALQMLQVPLSLMCLLFLQS